MKLTLAKIWNESLIGSDRTPVERDYLWSSQLGKPPIDLWLHMKGTSHSNTPNDRSRRKFMAGNFFEHMVSMVLMRSGLMLEKQEEIWTNYDIRVKGKGDFILTGKFDFDKAVHDIKAMFLPSEMERMYLQISDNMRSLYEGTTFSPAVVEVKSVAERTMTRIEKAEKPLSSHIMQTAHYKLGRKLDNGIVAVICRDDLRLFEYYVTKDDEQDYINKVNELAAILKSKDRPDLEKPVLFDTILGKFNKNLGIEYSNFLTMLYGYERPDQYSDEVKPKISRWNRVLARIKDIQDGKTSPTGKELKLTPKNELAIKEMENEGFNAKELAQIADVVEEEEEA